MRYFLPTVAVSALTLLSAGPLQAQDLNKARYLAANCANCHGTDGNALSGNAVLAGYDRDKFIRTMNQYKSGEKPATIMHQIAKGYTDEQIGQLAVFFSSQRPR